jgi:hypothetical protein
MRNVIVRVVQRQPFAACSRRQRRDLSIGCDMKAVNPGLGVYSECIVLLLVTSLRAGYSLRLARPGHSRLLLCRCEATIRCQ